MAKYLILIYDNEATWATADPEATNGVTAGHGRFAENAGKAILGGDALQATSTATSLRPSSNGGFAVTDGPFVETKEALGGYYVVEAADLDEAIALAKQIPVIDGGVEVRPVLVYG